MSAYSENETKHVRQNVMEMAKYILFNNGGDNRFPSRGTDQSELQ